MTPFTLAYTLTRRQRLRVELVPWLPAIAGTIGFSVGAAYLTYAASSWFLVLLALPVVMYRGLFLFAFDLIVRGGRTVTIHVDDEALVVDTAGQQKRLPLQGVLQVFRADDLWTVLHLDGTVLLIPDSAISPEQIAFLRVFAHRTIRAARAEEEAALTSESGMS
ncbi:MAG: hypothetical protein RMJ56_12160 [Gemmataceae bacterium]|nr:hypothetical protein [Gemmata sp.]MDW8198346.1 hypothetical protein [Gemmataceae bacterium]